MALVNSTLAVDFARHIAERTALFHGRGWVFCSINQWLASPDGNDDGHFFLLTGEPGSGKSAIAGRLVQFSQGSQTPPEGLSQLKPDFLSAIHFCYARDSNWVDPHTFARSIALQLANRYTEYAQALLNVGEKSINMPVQQNVEEVGAGATVAGFIINNIVLSEMSPRNAFNRTVLDPLRSIYNSGFDAPITILVDALDESLSHETAPKILDLISSLKNLPSQVRFILTSRDDQRVTNEFLDASGLFLSDKENNENNQKDIADYVKWRLNNDERFAVVASNGRLSELAEKLKAQENSNFQYVTFLLDAIATKRHPLEDLNNLPVGLDKLYYDSLKRVVKQGNKNWDTEYAPLMGVLSVAREPLSFEQLQSFIGISDEVALAGRLRDLQQFMETVTHGTEGGDADESVEQYRLYHQSVVDFLHRPVLGDGKKQAKNTYHLRPVQWHRLITDSYLKDGLNDWSAFDDYGLRHIVTHLAEVVQANKGPQQKAERHHQTERLANLAMNRDFQAAHRKRIKDLAALQRDLEQALRCATVDDDKNALFLIIKMALALVVFRKEQLRPEQLFELARRGEIKEAERQLDLFSVELEWKVAVWLVIAWLASGNNPEGARKLRDRAAQQSFRDPNLQRLLQRLNAFLDGQPLQLPSLPPPPYAQYVAEVVKRFGGLNANVEMLETYERGGTGAAGDPLLNPDARTTNETGYMSELDGPLLVSFAVANPTEGAGFLNDYLSVYTNYNYAHYRNRSLWVLLRSILLHPEQNWVESMLPVMASIALSGSVLEFQESLPLTVLGLQAQGGDSTASLLLEESRVRFSEEAQRLSSNRGQGDLWGSHKRRLAALAEVFSVLLNRQQEALDLLALASSIPYGFAGFQSPVCLTLAESIRICNPQDTSHIDEVLDASHRAAHNIQDATYCMRLTARFNAMSQRWWKQSALMLDPASVVKRFRQNPSDREFAALHIVGEPYHYRPSDTKQRLPLSEDVRRADTLVELARLYQRPLSEFERLNHGNGWASEEHLPPATEVNVPDPGFATQLAARFAADVLANDTLADDERIGLLQPLVPFAVANSTSLDCILSRLLLAARPTNTDLLEKITKVARSTQESAVTSLFSVNEVIVDGDMPPDFVPIDGDPPPDVR